MKYFVIQNYLNYNSENLIDFLENKNVKITVFVEKLSLNLLKRYYRIYSKTHKIHQILLLLFKIIIKNCLKFILFKKRIRKYIYLKDINSFEFINICKKKKFRFGLLLNSPIIKKEILYSINIPIINVHVGQLPHYRNKFSNIKAMLDNNNPAVTVHQIDEFIDYGKILSVIKFPYLNFENMKILDLKTNNIRMSVFSTFEKYFLKNKKIQTLKAERNPKQLEYELPTQTNLIKIESKKKRNVYANNLNVSGMLKNQIRSDIKKKYRTLFKFYYYL